MIAKWQAGLGLAIGAVLILSALAHSFIGGPDLRSQLELAATSLQLIRGVMLGWNFGGMAMVVFGVIVSSIFWNAWQAKPVSLLPARVIGIAYLVFGILAIAFVERNPFYAAFVLPGLLLLLATGFRSPPGKRT